MQKPQPNELNISPETLRSVESRGYRIQPFENNVYALKGVIELEDRSIPCDTAFSKRDVPTGERVEFTTFIHEGWHGKNVEYWDRVIDNLNYELPGKVVQDYTDNSHDIMYVTSEPALQLDANLIIENIKHHAETKARLLPHLEDLQRQIDITELPRDSEKFAREFVNQLKARSGSHSFEYHNE